MKKELFISTVAQTLKDYGFSKSGSKFWKLYDDITIIIDLQKSSLSNSYYVNVGFFINDLIKEDPKKLKAYQADINTRICEGTKVVVNGKMTNSYAFDLDEDDCTEYLVRSQLTRDLALVVLPISSLAKIRQIVETGGTDHGGYVVTASAMEYFSNRPYPPPRQEKPEKGGRA